MIWLRAAFDELRAMLMLLLSCAVQCDQRQSFIENIQRLSVEIQQAIADCITQVNLLTCDIADAMISCTFSFTDPLI